MGSRYGGLKQIDPVGPSGETVLDYAVFDAVRAGFKRVVFVIREEFAQLFKDQVAAKYAGHIAVDYVFQALTALPEGFAVPAGREKPWGTGHAVWCARAALGGNFAVINADDFYGAAGYRTLAAHFAASADYAMVGYPLKQTLSEFGTVSRGLCATDAAGRLKSITEITKIEKTAEGARYTDAAGAVNNLTGDEIVSLNTAQVAAPPPTLAMPHRLPWPSLVRPFWGLLTVALAPVSVLN